MATKKDDFSIKKISPKLGGERGARNPNGPTSSHDLVEQMEFLYVEVIKAINNSARNPRGYPIIEIILGNYKSSTKTLPIGPNMDWNQIFAFDKSKGDVLSVHLSVLIDKEIKTLIGKRSFKLSTDIPSRTPPDARIAPQWYSMEDTKTGYQMDLLMSVWFGTQIDEVYSQSWFSDASDVKASNVINTRPKIYIAPRLCQVRVTIVSCHDLIPTDRKRTPSVYIKAILGSTALKSKVSSGLNPSWNQDLLFVSSEPLEETLYLELIDRVDEQHEECIGKLKKKLTEMTPVKVPGSAPVLFYDIEPPVKVEPGFDSRRFSSRIKMKLATDQAYHVFDECIQYCSDYRAFAKGLWPGLVGKLEIGILGATGLKSRDETTQSIDSYVVAKYGNKWIRTRTVVANNFPKWNEQYSWEVYDKSTVFTLGIYENRQIFNPTNDVPIGKVRIPLNLLRWNMIYTCSYPITYLGANGLKKMGEIQLAIRCVCITQPYGWVSAPFRWMLPKAHYKSPLSVTQIDKLRSQAVDVNCLNLAKTEPPLRKEVVQDMLKPKSKSFSLRRTKANYMRCYRIALYFYNLYDWIDTKIVSTTEILPKVFAFFALSIAIWFPCFVLWFGFLVKLCFDSWRFLWRVIFKEYVKKKYDKIVNRIDTHPPILNLIDLNLWGLESPNLDELAEEFDSFPSSLTDVNVLRMRYDRSRKILENLMMFMGDFATQFERFFAVFTWRDDPFASFCFSVMSLMVLLVVCVVWYKIWLSILVIYWLNFPCFRNDLPSGIKNFFRRLPSNEEMF